MSRKNRSPGPRAAARIQSSLTGTKPPASHDLPAPVGTPVERWSSWLVPGLIALVTFAAFLPTLQNEFVSWDDGKNFLENRHYRGLGWSRLTWMWTTFHSGHYMPLTWMTLGLDYQLWGLKPAGYHLTNLLLHVANAVLFYFLACRVLAMTLLDPRDRARADLAFAAAVGSLLFSLHPLRVESVAWATERRDVLSGLCYLLAILVYFRACERNGHGRWWYWGAVALSACAQLSKSMAVSLPLVLLILDVYPLRRLGGSVGWWSRPARRAYVEKIPFVLMAGVTSSLALLGQVGVDNLAPLDRVSLLGRLAISTYGLTFYLWKTVVPVKLSPLYELRDLHALATPFVLSYAGVVAITILAWARRRSWPGLLTAWIAYVAILMPVLGLLHNGPQIAADRYTYLAGLGWMILAGAGLQLARRRAPLLTAALAALVLVCLGALTWNQVKVWHDSAKLWDHALAVDPESPTAHLNRGAAFADHGSLAEAIEHYRRALAIRPDFADALTNLGSALSKQGKLAEAVEHYRQALEVKPASVGALTNLGVALARQAKSAEAIEHYRRALAIRPDHAEAQYNWGVALARQGKPAEAIEHYQRALAINPDFAEALTNVGMALVRLGKPAEAIGYHRRAIEIRPDFAEALTNLGVALGQQGKANDAIEYYRRALEVDPRNVRAHMLIGAVHERRGDFGKAISAYERALAIDPRFASAANNVAYLYAEHGGDKDKALQYAQRAREAAPHEPAFSDTLGWILYQRGVYQRALGFLKESAAKLPDNPDVRFHLGMTHYKLGDRAAARQELSRAMALSHEFAGASEARRVLAELK